MKPTHFTNQLLLVFQKKHVNCNHTNLAKNSVYEENIDFLNKSGLILHQNASNQRNIQNCNETNPFYQ